MKDGAKKDRGWKKQGRKEDCGKIAGEAQGVGSGSTQVRWNATNHTKEPINAGKNTPSYTLTSYKLN